MTIMGQYSEKSRWAGRLGAVMAFLVLLTCFSVFPVGAAHTEVVFSEDFSNQDETALKDKGWDWYPTTNPLVFDEGRLKLHPTKDGRPGTILMHVKNNAAAKNWTDYTVEVDMAFDADKANLLNSTNFSAVAVRSTGRNGSKGTGYEFGLNIPKGGDSSKATLRFRDVSAGKNLKDMNTGEDSPKFPLELGRTYRIKVEAIGNRFKCYIDNELVMEVEDDAHVKGTIGLTVGQHVAYFDNVTVTAEPSDPVPSDPDYTWFQPEERGAPDNALFFEGFASGEPLTGKGWDSDSPLLIDGHMFLDHNPDDETKQMAYLNQLEEAKSWNNYILEADVSISSQFFGKQKENFAGIVTKTDGKETGYEFALFMNEAGDTYARLYDRTNGEILKKVDFDLVTGETYRLKIAHTGEAIRCSVNGSLIIEVADDPSRTGSIGLRTGGYLVGYDNVTVYPYTQVDDGDEPDFGEGIYFSEYFTGEDALTDRGWSSDLPAIIDGQLQITNEVSPFYLNGKPTYLGLTDYTVEADVVMTDEATATFATNIACLVVRSTGASDGYEFGICIQSNGKEYVRLYDRKSKKVLVQENMDLEQNRIYHMAVTVEGNRITCYLDGEQVIDTTADTNASGSIGFRINGYTALCSNIVVKSLDGSTEIPDPVPPEEKPDGGETTTIPNAPTGNMSRTALPLLLAGLGFAAVAGCILCYTRGKHNQE